MGSAIVTALRLLAVMTLLTGGAYPLLVTLTAQAVAPRKAGGSIVLRNGVPAGSTLLAGEVDRARDFWPRPSAVSYDPSSSGGSNAGPTSLALARSVAERRAAFLRGNNLPAGTDVPSEMLTASGSGLDPHISPIAALLQVGRVAAARGLDTAAVARLVVRSVDEPTWGVLGEPRVNVVALNLALDTLR